MVNEEIVLMVYTDFFLKGLFDFFVWAQWFLIAGLVLTFADLKFGIEAARARKELIKRSRAVRRTVNKICEYTTWIIVAYTFGHAFGKPFGIDVLPCAILLVIYGVELESVYVNYFASKGKKVKVNVFKYFNKKNDIIEVEEDETDTK